MVIDPRELKFAGVESPEYTRTFPQQANLIAI